MNRSKKESLFPFDLLPPVVAMAGKQLKADYLEIGSSIKRICESESLRLNSKIHVALGDLQCSMYSCLENETDCGK